LQARDDLAVEKRPGRVAVQEQKRFADSLVDVVDASIVEVEEAVFDIEQLARHWERQRHATPWISSAIARGFSSEAKCPQRGSEQARTPRMTLAFASRSLGRDQSSLP